MGAASVVLILLAGWLIGATGIGGILVVPALVQFDGITVQRAIAASSLAFALPAVVALRWVRSAGTTGPSIGVAALMVGSVPGAVLGALLAHQMNSQWLFAGLGVLALASGAANLLLPSFNSVQANALKTPTLLLMGIGVGLGSALSGTGGPVILIPLLMLMRQPLPQTIVAAQAIQLPIALCASAAHELAGAIDVPMAGLLGVLLLAGAMVGRWYAQRMPVCALQRMLNGLLLAVGAWLLWRAFS